MADTTWTQESQTVTEAAVALEDLATALEDCDFALGGASVPTTWTQETYIA